MTNLIFKNEVFDIIGAAMEVHSILGPGFLEAVYQEAMEIEFSNRQIPFDAQVKVPIFFKDTKLKSYYVPDFLCYGNIVIEIKAIKTCSNNEEAQILNSIKATEKKLGLVKNFGEPSLYWKRFIN